VEVDCVVHAKEPSSITLTPMRRFVVAESREISLSNASRWRGRSYAYIVTITSKVGVEDLWGLLTLISLLLLIEAESDDDGDEKCPLKIA